MSDVPHVDPHAHPTDLDIAVAERRRVVQQRARILAQQEQRLVDAEVVQSRRDLLHAIRRRRRTNAVAFCDPDFLAVADPPTVHRAILDAAVTVAGAACVDLQVYDQAAGVLRIAAHHGFDPSFLTVFATVAADQPTACATALVTGQPVLIDDVTRSPIFAGQTTLEAILDAGSRAVYSYPLIVRGDLIGVLSLHHRSPMTRHGPARLVADSAAWALTRIDAR